MSSEAVPCECTYCGVSAAASLVKCAACSRWFCNGKGLLSGSHIVSHLVLLRHNVVQLHATLPLGAETLECYNCGNRNVFMLGFVAAKQDAVVVVLCRMPCAHQRDINWATNEWQPLVDGRALLPWVAPPPPAEAELRDVLREQVWRLEASWRMDKEASMADVTEPEPDAAELLPVMLRYSDALVYQNVYAPLVYAEQEYERTAKEQQLLENILVEWTSARRSHQAHFALPNYEMSDLSVSLGEEVVMRHHGFGDAWTGTGTIVLLPSAHRPLFTLELARTSPPPPQSTTADFALHFVWRDVTFSRMQRALASFATDPKCISAFLFHKILGHDVEEVVFSDTMTKVNVPGLAKLNPSQERAVALAVERPLLLIQGPPGTGKTVTSAAIIHRLSKLKRNRILVCAPLNVAADHLADKIHATGLKVVRLMAKMKEAATASASEFTLTKLVHRRALDKLRKLLDRKAAGEELPRAEYAAMAKLEWELATKIIASADVVCCTCVVASDKRLKGKFRTVLIDESTQAAEPQALIPIVRGAKQVILVGDHQQLGPVIFDRRANRAGLGQSLFERLIAMGHIPHRLEVQYRMNPALSEFSLNMFYDGLLQNGVTLEERSWPGSTFPWPVPGFPMMFWANYGKEELSANGMSFLNRVEAMNVEKVISRLFRDGVRPDQIGVITPYEGQRAYIFNYMQMNSSVVEQRSQFSEVEVTSVDAFQGREKDFIILSCVRANEERVIGFLKDPRRLNVALTRAKYGMIILGNPRALSRNKLWNNLLVHYRERGCLVEGPLDMLQLSLVPLREAPKNDFPSVGTREHDFDMQSMLSFVPEDDGQYGVHRDAAADDALDDKWPSLTANEVSKLLHEPSAHPAFDHGMDALDDQALHNIASAFASGLNL